MSDPSLTTVAVCCVGSPNGDFNNKGKNNYFLCMWASRRHMRGVAAGITYGPSDKDTAAKAS
jgi:hypothetical protein